MDVVSLLNSLLQWEPENIMFASSSMLVGLTDIVQPIIIIQQEASLLRRVVSFFTNTAFCNQQKLAKLYPMNVSN